VTYATSADRDAIEAEMSWEARDIPATLWGLIDQTAKQNATRPAVTFQLFSGPTDKAETLSWHELQQKVAQTANLLRSLGIGETDVVAVLLPNCNEAVLAYLGGAVAGIVNPINPLLDPQSIAGILQETNAKVLITLKPFPKSDVAQKAARAVELAPNVTQVLEVDLHRYLTGVKKLIVPLLRPRNPTEHKAKISDFGAAIAPQPKHLAFPDSHGDRIAAYFHTGGTTGTPKVAQHRYSGIIYNAWLGDRLLFDEQDSLICPLPMFHVFAAIVVMGASLGSGAHVVFPTPQGYRGDGVFDNFWKLCERYGITFMITVPTAMSALMQRPVDADISKLQMAFCGSAPLPVELYRKFEKAAGITICEGYGLTEATCLVSINPPDGEKKIGSIGLAFPYTDVLIANPSTGAPCEIDEIGEICVSNPGVSPGATYTEAAKNENLYWDKHLRTGDLGRRDADGYLWITGRAKDLIIRGGHNIDPAEIEEALAGHPQVAFAGAIGQPDAHAGEVPCVYVELVADADVTEAALMDHARRNIHERAAYPKHLEILPELPKTAVGKIFKPDLRRLAITRVIDGALIAAKLPHRVKDVAEDRRRGLLVRIDHHETGDEEAAAILNSFTGPWEWSR